MLDIYIKCCCKNYFDWVCDFSSCRGGIDGGEFPSSVITTSLQKKHTLESQVHARRNNKTLRFALNRGLNDRWVRTFTYYSVVSLLFWILAASLTAIGYYGEEETRLFTRRKSHIPHAMA